MQMLADIDAGLISTVIVKDMSRFGRNYLEVGLYTEIHFPEKGVRFIAINSNVDSDNPTENEFTPFLNVINEWYAKDTSRKICAIFKSRMSEGLRCSGSVPYGYIRLQGDKQTLVVDDEAAAAGYCQNADRGKDSDSISLCRQVSPGGSPQQIVHRSMFVVPSCDPHNP